jgi:UDP-N-acetylmuramoyl-L-alanyl-D-glutamate--2,6-diaminopimelate ligase
MLLFDLLRSLAARPDLSGVPNVQITGVKEDSRLVQPGNLFVARPGTRTDGAQFLADAAAKGAVAAIVAAHVENSPLPQIVIPRIAPVASILASTLHGRPDRSVRAIGITGTNGKTTTAYLLRHILASAGVRCGLIGTVENDDGRVVREANLTTPGACDIADLLASMRENGCRACAMEVSSHALDQDRAAGVNFAGAIFTNLTGDHIDYHLTKENYVAAKAKLFSSLDRDAVAAVNCASPWWNRMVQNCNARVVRFGLTDGCDYRATDTKTSAYGTHFVLNTPDGVTEVAMPMIGRHNIENALGAAVIAGELFGLTVHQIAMGLKDAVGAPGRLQPVRCDQPFAVFVDYAHTDDGLDNVLRSLRPVTKGKLRVMFGCGGDRDRTKRPRMAAIAEKLADAIYITSDNPRTEQPAEIVKEIVQGLSPAARKSAVIEPDRHKAIQRIIADAQPGDVVLLAGKGHENYQIVGTERRHFDDVEEAKNAIGSLSLVLGGEG